MTTEQTKAAAKATGNGKGTTPPDPPAPDSTPAEPVKAEPKMTTYLAFVWEAEGWTPILDNSKGGEQKQYVVPSGQAPKVQDTVLAELAASDKQRKSVDPEFELPTKYRIAIVSARYWVDAEFEQEPPPPPQFRRAGS